MSMKYVDFLNDLDKRLKGYFELHREHICCKAGCSHCCEEGDYPLSQMELEYLMAGYSKLEAEKKKIIQENIKKIVKGGKCPFLYDSRCLVYEYRPIICRVHGLAYICKNKTVKIPYCVTEGKNYTNVYDEGTITINPILENLDTKNVLKIFDYGEIRNLYDWIEE